MIVTIYDLATGAVRKVIDVAPHEVALNFDRATEAVHEGALDPAAVYVADGEPRPYPARPGPWAEWDGEAWIDTRTTADIAAELAAARAGAVAAINRLRGEVRGRFITRIPGQDMVYLEKEAEARDWIAARAAAIAGDQPDPADFPHIAAEVGPTAPDMDSVAQVYLNMAAVFRSISAVIEGETMRALAAAEAAQTGEAAQAAAADFHVSLVAALSAAGITH